MVSQFDAVRGEASLGVAVRKRAGFLVSFLSLSLLPLFGQVQVQVIPQVADGGGWATTIVLTNRTTTSQLAALKFRQQTTGGATSTWNPPFMESVSLASFNIDAGSTIFLHTTGTAAAVSQGWGELDATPGVTGYAIFTLKAGGRQQDATAPAVQATNRILVPFDNSSGFNTSIAVVNPTAAAEIISVNMRTTDGTTKASTLSSIPGNGQITVVLPSLLPETTGKAGLAEFSASGTFSIIALRSNPTAAFTASPVYFESGTPIIPNSSGNAAGTTAVQVIPQVADGLGWSTTIVLTNRTTKGLPYTLKFNQNIAANGATTPWNPPFLENGASSGTLPGGSTIFLHTSGLSLTVLQGWGELDADLGISGYAIFTSKVGSQNQDATAPAVTATSRVLVPFDNTSGLTTAVAVVNPTGTDETISVDVRTSDGVASTVTLPIIPAFGQVPLVMPTLVPQTAGKAGLSEFYVSGTLSIVALRANATGAFTAAPVNSESGTPIISVSGGGNGGGGGGNGGGGGGGSTSGNTNPTQDEINSWIARGSYTAGQLSLTRSTSYATTDLPGVPATTSITKTDAFTGLFSTTGGADLGKLLRNQLPPGFPVLNPTAGSCVVYNINTLTNPYPNITTTNLDAGPQLTSNGPNGTQLALRQTNQITGPTYRATNVPNTYLATGRYALSGPGGPGVGAFNGNLDTVSDLVVANNPDDFKTINRSSGITVNWAGGEPSSVLTISGQSFSLDLQTSTASGAAFVCIENTSAGHFTVPASVLMQLPASPVTPLGGGFSLITRGSFSVTASGAGARFTAPAGVDILTANNFWLWSYTPLFQ